MITKDQSLQASNAACKKLLRELTAENLKLQKQIAKLQAQNISYKNKITALEGEAKKRPYLYEFLDQIDGPSK